MHIQGSWIYKLNYLDIIISRLIYLNKRWDNIHNPVLEEIKRILKLNL